MKEEGGGFLVSVNDKARTGGGSCVVSTGHVCMHVHVTLRMCTVLVSRNDVLVTKLGNVVRISWVPVGSKGWGRMGHGMEFSARSVRRS